MIDVAISVEGPTEEEFTKTVLAEHLRASDVNPIPILIDDQGGNVTVDRLASDMARLAGMYSYVTSLVDYYGFSQKGNLTVVQLENSINLRVNKLMLDSQGRLRPRQRVFSYVQRHEFEGLLFSDVHCFSQVIDVPVTSMDNLINIRSDFPTPEDINDNSTTAPSKRIEALFPAYRKRNHSPLIAEAVGLQRIRDECPRFNEWLARLESVGVRPSRRKKH